MPAAASHDDSYRPRFVAVEGEGRLNRLAESSSPYLLQHARNPVDWHPWDDAALATARRLDRPIFLSVGYSTCYWCHVMERESFENPAVAGAMNRNFVCIKVDREQRPDLDDLYMTAVQLFSNGHGGWPMTVFLEPERLRPFFAGTYFPPDDRHGRAGLVTLMEHIATAWKSRREELLAQAARAADAIGTGLGHERSGAPPDATAVDRAVSALLDAFDPRHGGFDRAPKFPQPARLHFLAEAAPDDPRAQDAVGRTLDAMALGGICDQVGGGFHRYSTDERWLVPHFEKMLYDNALLAEAYALSVERTGDSFHARVLRQTLDWVLREMTAPSGRFYSAQDAEVDAREGASYVWMREEFDEALGSDADFAASLFGLEQGPNFRDPHHPEAEPANVLFLDSRPADVDLDRIDRVRAQLLRARDRRRQPITDDKSLAGWNGLMIAGMAEGGRVLDHAGYVDAAARAADFALEQLWRSEAGGLLRCYRADEASIPAYLEDYAFLVHGLLRLHRARPESRWLDAAVALTDEARELFRDRASGTWFDSRAGQEDLFVRVRTRYDGATPSGGSQMCINLFELARIRGDEASARDATHLLGSLAGAIGSHPLALLVATRALAIAIREFPRLLEGGTAVSGPVQLTATRESPAPDGTVRARIELEIAEGFHVNAHQPGHEQLAGLTLEAEGARLLEVVYPEGEPFETAGLSARVYTGRIEIPVTVDRGGANAELRFRVRYQACDEQACLSPREEILVV